MMLLNKPVNYVDENVDPHKVEVLLANELSKLSFTNRENINEEIHGVHCLAPKETPEMLELALEKLSEALEAIPSADKQAFLQSQDLFPNNRYVNDRNFRLMFLRCELFDPRKAAIRLVRHLDFVLDIFDDKKELLGRPVRLTDLSPSSMKLLRSGCLQLLPVRDNSGRRVFFLTAFKIHYDVFTRLQIFCYFQTVLSEDVDNQRTGFVSVAMPGEYSSKVKSLPSRKDRYKLTQFVLSAPVRFCAAHSCYPDTPLFNLMKAVYSLGMHASESTRFRFKFHTGGDTEVRYQLMGFGIPVDQLPITSSGKVKYGNMNQWINVRTKIETQRMQKNAIVMGDICTNIIECPSLNDVAIRPGKSYLCHPGNVNFKELLNKNMEKHAAANRRGKDIISWGIIEEIESGSGRFLEWDNVGGYWIENKDRNIIRSKIPVYFRDHKRNTKMKRKQLQHVLKHNNDNAGGTNCLKLRHDKKMKIMVGETECNLMCCRNTTFND